MRVLSINSEENWSKFVEKTTERETRLRLTTFNDDDELEHMRYPNETQAIVVVLVVVVEIVTSRFDDDDARRTRTRETFKTTSGENTDESE